MIYLDTSIVIPNYWPELLSEASQQLLRIETQRGLSQLVEVEFFSALSRRVRMREISQEEARQIAIEFQRDLDDFFYTRIPLQPFHYQQAREWIGRFDTALRTLDAIHLAIAAANDLRLVTADEALAEAANVFGIAVQLITP
ncbi:type II toxin-antitoxin system VapC family toxin [Aerosakkonema funiforme]|uniref:type II toxin-antitoxin system VapC family toxin n=1 Tax=Aerosakkonema funiforme TaxID=1246630 RepID=UPI0035BAAE4D